MIKIGFIAAHNSIEKVKKLKTLFQDQCEITFIPYQEIKEIKDLYEQNHLFYDGILLGGKLTMYFLQQEFTELPTQTFYLEITEGDFYKNLFAIQHQQKDLSFSRVYIDFLHEYPDSMGLQDVLGEDELPYSFECEYTEGIYERTFQRHLSLWRQGKIDLSITRFSNIVSRLNEAGIPNMFIFPSEASVLEQVQQFINELQISNLQDNQWAIGIITIENLKDQSDLDFKQVLLHKALLEFNKNTNSLSVIQKQHANFEIITSNAELKNLTNDFTNCSVIQYLNETLPFRVNIGWGIRTTLCQTKKAAQTAIKKAESNEIPCAYVIIDNEDVIGPLGSDSCLHYSNKIDPEIEQLSKTLEISNLYIQKIMAVISKMQTNELTADDLAYHLGHTLRQSNRILNKLEEKGAAKTLYRKQEKLRGRPKKVYKIDFRNYRQNKNH
ncbi:transcriptional regulator [Niallia endozanthoxylica]|uniref:Transcriptional regulator n=1 Tax=Niallia endozanthoxylica TaxID=2036016 RepID=A0A5J5HG68_9BACI|nr:transcriptional regulator [Niallia endozanthoxylica]KAA9018998.1 transcriptional regulator [Niallia endozanthoxylica]